MRDRIKTPGWARALQLKYSQGFEVPFPKIDEKTNEYDYDVATERPLFKSGNSSIEMKSMNN